jgi:predicted membrane-bound spermidine synthase
MPSKASIYKVLFALSGFAGLIYEGMWAKYLKLLIGHSSYGQILTLLVFMGGLAIGSFVSAKLVDRVKRPLMWYVGIELFIGGLGLVFHNSFVSSRELLWTSGLIANQGPTLSMLVAVFVGMCLTLPQAIALGMTFPFAVAGIIKECGTQSSRDIPALYFVNSIGGVLGILLTSFFLVPKLGLPGTLTFAGLLNVCIALGFYLASKKGLNAAEYSGEAESAEVTKSEGVIPPVWMLLFVSFGTGLTSFFYEIGWIRLLALVLGSSTHAFDLMVSAFILGLGGGAFYVWRVPAPGRNLERLVKAQVFMGLAAALGVFGAEGLFRIQHASHSFLIRSSETWGMHAAFQLALCILLMCPASFFAGMTLPLLTTSLVGSQGKKSFLGHVYGWNTLGSILGACIAGLVLLPILGVTRVVAVGALLDVCLAALLLWKTPYFRYSRAMIIGSSLICLIAMFTVLPNDILVSGGFRFQREGARLGGDSLWVRHGRTATVSVAQFGTQRIIGTNGKPDGTVNMALEANAQAKSDELTQAMCAWLPMSYHPAPKTVAMVGMGTGMSVHFLMADKRLERLDLIEIEPEMINLANLMRPKNNRAYTDRRVETHIEDARTFLARSGKKYDVIISEPSNPWVSGVSSLFTREFYRDMSRHLSEDGVLLQWVQTYEFNDSLFASILQALHSEYPYVRIHGVPRSGDLIFVASKRSLNSDSKRLSSDSTVSDLRSLGMNGETILPRTLLGTERMLGLMEGYSPMNSEFAPFVDLYAEKAMYSRERVAFVRGLSDQDVPLQRWIEPGWDTIQNVKNMIRAQSIKSEDIRAIGFRPGCLAGTDVACWDRYLGEMLNIAPVSTWKFLPGGLGLLDSLKPVFPNLPDTSIGLYVKWRLRDTTFVPDSITRIQAAKLLRQGLTVEKLKLQVMWAGLFWKDPLSLQIFQTGVEQAISSKNGLPLEMYLLVGALTNRKQE